MINELFNLKRIIGWGTPRSLHPTPCNKEILTIVNRVFLCSWGLFLFLFQQLIHPNDNYLITLKFHVLTQISDNINIRKLQRY